MVGKNLFFVSFLFTWTFNVLNKNKKSWILAEVYAADSGVFEFAAKQPPTIKSLNLKGIPIIMLCFSGVRERELIFKTGPT